MKISTRGRYALRLLIDLAQHYSANEPSYEKLKDVAERQEISRDYLEQLALSLKSANLVRSVSGREGGYALARPPEEINVLEVIEAAIGPINITECLGDIEVCHRADKCLSRNVWDTVNENIKNTFADIRLDRLMGAEGCPAILESADGDPAEMKQT